MMATKRVTFSDQVSYKCFSPTRRITKDCKTSSTATIETPLRSVASEPRLTVAEKLSQILTSLKLRRTPSNSNIREVKCILLM
ncbi:hypothetical protein DSO57_1026929 [Entomophthora muscae]|uniref:Uncharacterized protein n=1 Tax=Entomophthora muscae TaxID=34485 RepID=A0ACC2RT05_9FUNG|nr:hypothetical protein DSO57_1026929 [Entomophthora muscae]